jgi:3',5'-cyclic AMP phosphodiesterase CpdA
VITGDLAHKAELAAYQGMATQLARLSMPVYPLPGNHDLRAPMREALPDAPRDEHGFMQAVLRRDRGRLHLPRHARRGREWRQVLREALRLAGGAARGIGRSPGVPLHAPPAVLDPHPVRRPHRAGGPERFAAIVDGRRNIRHLFYGHVHRPVCGSWHGIPVSTMRGLNHQVPFDLVTESPVPKSHEPPA